MNMQEKIKVLIVDDHDMVRKGLKILLESFNNFEVVADIDNGQMALTLCRKYQPDVVLMDIFMPGIDGITATRMIHESWPAIQIIALTSIADEKIIHDVVQAGAISYLLKNGSIDEVADAVRAAYHHQPTLSTHAIQALISTTQHPYDTKYDLTKRQREVLELMIRGLNNRQIANQLVISNSTVKNHICSIYSKLNTTNRTQTVAMAIKLQILDKVK
jgi:two-component system, NarL family, response regulator LiaR